MAGTTGRVERIWLKRMKGGPMDPQDRATLVAGRGLAGNANQGGKRQITILSRETWERITAPLSAAPNPARRRANLLVSGVDIANSRGRILRVGGHRIRLNGETRPCEQMEAPAAGLQAGLSEPWGGGVFGEVLDDGSSKDLRALQKRSLAEGIPYQTLVSSVLHKFVEGQMIEQSANKRLEPTRSSNARLKRDAGLPAVDSCSQSDREFSWYF